MDIKDKKNFVASFVKAYEALNLKNYEAFIASNATTLPAVDQANKHKFLTERLCEARTTKKIVKRARKGVLVES